MMDIRFNKISDSIKMKLTPQRKAGGKKPPQISDSVVKGITMKKLPQKPVIAKSSTVKAPDASLKNITSDPSLLMATSSVPSPAALSIGKVLEELSKKNVSFLKKRSIRIPGMAEKNKPIDLEAAKNLMASKRKSKKDSLSLLVAKTDVIENPTEEDLKDLLILRSDVKSPCLQSNEVLDFVKEAKDKGYYLYVNDSEVKGAFNVYRHLMERGTNAEDMDKPILIVKDRLILMSVKPEEMKDIAKIRNTFNSRDQLFKDLGNCTYLTGAAINAPEGVPYPQRSVLAEGVYNYCKDFADSLQEKNAAKLLDKLTEKTGDPAVYAQAGKMLVESLEAHGNERYEESYEKGVDFIVDNMMDKPGDFKVFLDALKQGIDYDGAMTIYENLPRPVKQGDFEKVTRAFVSHKDFTSPDKIEVITGFSPDAPVSDKAGIAKSIYSHSKANYESQQLENTRKDFESLEKLSGSGEEFVKLGKMYVRMLDTIGSEDKLNSYEDGMKLIGESLKDKPGEFEVFLNAIKNGVKTSGAAKIYRKLPDTGEKISYKQAAEIFHGKELAESKHIGFLMPQIENTTLSDRVSIAEGIYRHSEGYHSNSQWDNTKEDIEHIKTLCKDEKDFAKIGKIYVEMLDANGSKKQTNEYKAGLDFIASHFRNKPGESKVFIDLIKGGATISGAIQVFESMPETASKDDLRQTADVLKGSKLQDRKHIEMLMTPVGSSTLKERLNLAEAIYKHSEENLNIQTWASTVKDFGHIKELAKNDDDFAKIGKCYTKFLDAYGKNQSDSSCKEAREFIAAEMLDKPEDFDVFLSLVKNNMTVAGAEKMYELLPKPVQKGKYDSVAKVFKGSNLTRDFQVELVMEDIEGTIMEDRHDILNSIFTHSENQYFSKQWQHTENQYEMIKEKARDGADFTKTAKCYGKILDARKSKEYDFDQARALEFLIGGLKDNPGDVEAFVDFVKGTDNVFMANELYEKLSDSQHKYSFKEAVEAMKNGAVHYPDTIDVIADDIPNTTLKERYEFFDGVFRHYGKGNKSQRAKIAEGSYELLKQRVEEKGIDFNEVKNKYLSILKGTNPDNNQYLNQIGLEFVIDKLAGNQDGYDSFQRILKTNRSIHDSIKVYDKIQEPVSGAVYREREEAATKLGLKNFTDKYDMAARNIAKGEKLEDSTALVEALFCARGEESYKHIEAMIKQVQIHKGNVKSSEIVNLVKKLRLYDPTRLTNALDELSQPFEDSSYSEREKIFISLYDRYHPMGDFFEEALADYTALRDGILPGETLEETGKRLEAFVEMCKNNKHQQFIGDPKSIRDAFVKVSNSMANGGLQGKTMEEILDMLMQNLVLTSNGIGDAAEHVVFNEDSKEEQKIKSDGNEVVIGGVRLKKGPAAQS